MNLLEQRDEARFEVARLRARVAELEQEKAAARRAGEEAGRRAGLEEALAKLDRRVADLSEPGGLGSALPMRKHVREEAAYCSELLRALLPAAPKESR